MREKISFIKLIRSWGIVFLIALAGIIVSIDILYNYQDFNIRADKMRTDYVEQQKQRIKREVRRVVDMINYEKAQTEALAKTEINSRVYEVYSIVQNIYEQNKELKSDAEIQRMIVDVLRPIRFNDGRGYYFIDSLSGENILYPPHPSFEGQNIVNLRDSRGEYIVKKEFELLREKGEGFVTGYWSKPDTDSTKDFKKITFVKIFKPYDWSIGTGLYVDDIEEQIKAKLIGQINNIRFDKNGYIFVDDWLGISVAHGTQPDLIGTDMWECENSRGTKTTQRLIAASKKEDGGYVSYWWRKPDTGKECLKIAYAKGVPEWKWCVGTGVYTDDIEQDIATLQAALNAQTKAKILIFIITVVTAFALFLILFNWLSNRLRKDLNLFISFFDRAAYSDKKIEREAVRFIELDQMAEYANKMLQDKINAQQDLLDEREQLFVTIRSIGDGVITTDTSGRVELMNKVAEQLTGWNQDNAAGRMLSEVFNVINEKTREAVEHPVNTVLAEGRIVGLANHTILISKDGTEYNVADSAAPIRDIKSNIRGVVLVFRDVTEKLKTEEELFKSKKLESIGVLAGGIAHDFNNIFTGLFGNIELAKMELSRDHEAYPHIEAANQALERATNLTKQLLTFAKGGDPILEEVNLQQVVQTSITFNLSGSNVKAHLNLPDDLWQVKADKGQISQVIANLIINAKQAMPDGGSLYIEAENIKDLNESTVRHLSGDFVKFSIRDEGVGISAKHVERIFDPYFSTKQTGSGLGLAAVLSIITQHNGHISVASKPDIGTTFTIFLPAEKSSYKPTVTTHLDLTEKPTSTSGHILVMDDEEMVRNVSAAMLKRCGYTVDFAVDGEAAIEKYISADKSGNSFDIVIMDLTIPGGMGGKEAVNRLLAIDPEAKVIVSSGYSTDPVMANYSDYGFKGRLVKPFQMETLKTEICRVIEVE
jgi:PAS domain S-box-containing protein